MGFGDRLLLVLIGCKAVGDGDDSRDLSDRRH